MSDRYELELPALGITFEADRLRRERHELHGELTVRCAMPGAKTVNGVLNVGDFNFSSVRARQDRARLLEKRAGTNGDLDWFGLLEDLCQRVFEAERTGDPAVDLRELPRPEPGDEIRVEGIPLPRRHPTILFGDGGAAKSYMSLYLAGQLAVRGMRIALFDWELAGEDHRDRLERLFGSQMPQVFYARCERPVSVEGDRLRRIVRERGIEYAIFDSIAFACDGPPEAAEVAGRYFRAVREIGVGSLHVAHVNRSEQNDRKPFGSTFWHNGARSTWFIQASEQLGNDDTLRLGLFNRKANLGGLRAPTGFVLNFTEDRTYIRRGDVADTPDLAVKLSVRQRIAYVLRKGALMPEQIAEEIEAEPETVRRTVRRYQRDFVVLDGGRIGLKGAA